MTTCGQCGQTLGEGRFCTQCGAPVVNPEQSGTRTAVPALAGASAFGGPSSPPPPAGSHRPLFADSDRPSRPGTHDSLAETAVRPMASLSATPETGTRQPGLMDRLGPLAEKLVAEAKRWLATADPTWVSVLGIGVGGMLVALLLGMMLLFV